MTRLRPHLATGQRLIVTLRDGAAFQELAEYISAQGFENSRLVAMQALGGPREEVHAFTVKDALSAELSHPLCVALEISGAGRALPRSSGIADDWFESDGQITKRPVRALTLSALAPRPFEHLWDIGGGSGSIAIEWLPA